MNTFYEQMRGVADALLGPSSDFAQGELKLRRTIPGAGPAHNPGPGTTVDFPVSGTVRGVSQQHIDGTLVVAGDKVASIAVPEVVPTTADKLIVDGKLHQISRIDRKPAAGVPVAYLIFIKA